MPIMQLNFTTLDVFTTTRYIGNRTSPPLARPLKKPYSHLPALAVILVPAHLRSSLTETQKQLIAREFNLSEVTFLHEPSSSPTSSPSSVLDYDIFTPLSPISFAGHPTIGTAIFVATHFPSITALRTIAGLIPFKYDAASGRATVSIPHDVHTHEKTLTHPLTQDTSVPIVSIVKGMAFGLCELPDLKALGDVAGPLIPSESRFTPTLLDSESGWDVGYTGSFYYVDLGLEDDGVRVLRTRSYPAHEDPGTGSASAALCCYIVGKEGKKGVVKFRLTQGVEMGRRCDIYVEVVVREDGGIEDVRLSGQAVAVMEGSLNV
jgi:predicted PhzF superfamily epimerase YddE/YHI9